MIVATLRREARDRLRASTGELTRDTRALLDAATTIELASTADDDAEQAAARAAYPQQPLTGSGLAERLGYAPELLQVYLDSGHADPVLHMVIRTAIDWVRTGMPRPIPERDLIEITAAGLWEDHPDLDNDVTAVSARGPAGPHEAARQQRRRHLDHVSPARPCPRLSRLRLPRRRRRRADRSPAPGARPSVGADPRPSRRPKRRLPGQCRHLLPRHLPVAIDASHLAAEAAQAGHTVAQFNLGVVLADRLDPPELEEARRWWTEAAQAGHTSAQNKLGLLLADRLDPPELDEARRWYTRAANSSDAAVADAAKQALRALP